MITHSTNVYIRLNERKIYFFSDTVHLIKNITNNLLTRKRFLFLSFYFNNFFDNVHIADEEISWHSFHKVYEEDQQFQANLKAAPKLTASVLHLGNCNQSAPVALAIYHLLTSAAITNYFPER